jgi:O-acetyl-ADP-ribose deacetylase (regulator of RNase III)
LLVTVSAGRYTALLGLSWKWIAEQPEKIVAGEAVFTRAFDLLAEFVIHAAAPSFFDGDP